MDYLTEYRRYKQLYLDLQRLAELSMKKQISVSDSESSDIDHRYTEVKNTHQKLLSDDNRSIKQRQLKKIKSILDRKGYAYVFYAGKPILAAKNGTDVKQKMVNLAASKPEKYDRELVVIVTISMNSKYLMNRARGALVVHLSVSIVKNVGPRVRIHPRDQKNSSIRIFYNVDEIERFKLSKLAPIVVAAEQRKFNDTIIGHYQYTEVEEILKK